MANSNSVTKEREKAVKKAEAQLQVYNQNGGGGLTSSIRGAVSGFDINVVRLPGVYSFRPENEGKTVEEMYFLCEQGGFVRITKEEAEAIRKNNNKRDYYLLAVAEAKGQLGPNDYKCNCILEQIIYKEINFHYKEYTDGAQHGDCQEVFIGTKNQFALAVFGRNNGDAYSKVDAFLQRIKGLGFTIEVSSGFSNDEKGFKFSYKTQKDMPPIVADGFFRPFPGSILVGKVSGNQKLYLKVHNKIILNILNGGTKLQFNEIINSISNSKTKHLFRLLSLFDTVQSPAIYLTYSYLVEVFELERHLTQSEAIRQIGRIASPMNYDMDNKILLWDKSGSEKRPFNIRPLTNKNDWQFVFNMNSCTTPNLRWYVHKAAVAVETHKRYSDYRNLLLQLREDAAEIGMPPEEYVVAFADVLAERVKLVSKLELERIQRYFDLKVNRQRNLGARFEKLYGEDAIKSMLLLEQQKKLEAEQNKIEHAAIVEVEKPKRGRPKNKKPYVEDVDEIPF